MLLKVWYGRPANQASKTMRYDTDLSQAVSWAVLVNVSIDLLGESHTHFGDIALSMVFVGLRHQKHDFWEN